MKAELYKRLFKAIRTEIETTIENKEIEVEMPDSK